MVYAITVRHQRCCASCDAMRAILRVVEAKNFFARGGAPAARACDAHRTDRRGVS
jgi:hypothetical protein